MGKIGESLGWGQFNILGKTLDFKVGTGTAFLGGFVPIIPQNIELSPPQKFPNFPH